MKATIYLLCTALVAAVGCDKASGELRSNDEKRTPAAEQPRNEADNTRRNARERDNASPTPVDQGNNEMDLTITQNIRKSLMADDALSTNAKNVKVISKSGKVTLVGAVKSADEKASVEAKAKAVAGVENVESKLEIETN